MKINWFLLATCAGAFAVGLSLPTRRELAREAVREEIAATTEAVPAGATSVVRLADGRIDGTQLTAFSIRNPDGVVRSCVLAETVR